MKALRAISMICVVLLAGFGIVSAQDSAISTNQPTFSQHASSDVVHTTALSREIGVKRLHSGPPSVRMGAPLKLRARARHTAKPMISGTITYICDPSVAAATCNYLNTVVASDYSSTFTNANASIYITYGTTGLGESEQYFNLFPYSQYVAALTSNTSQSAIQVAALSALNTYDATPYGSDNVNVTGALGTALGFTGLTGIQVGGISCTLGITPGCYNAIITVTNAADTFYYDNLGGTEPADEYDFYGVVEHETDEVLGTSSCISTQDPSGLLTDPCDFAGGTGTPSAVDLYRYNSAGELALNSSYIGLASAPAGAYFSYNGGTTNGANGVANTPKVYNTLANGDDYADFLSSTPDCGTDIAVQDAEGCPGEDAGLTILNDGGGEINILNAVGYNVPTAANFSLSASPNNVTITQGGSSGTSTITITPSNGFTGNVTLTATGLPNGVTAIFSPNPATTTSTLTLAASATAATGTVTVTITGTSGSLTNSTTLSLTVNAPQNFNLSASPNSVTITQGTSGTSTVTITPSNGFSGSVTLGSTGLPTGVTAIFNPNPATTTSTLTLTASATAATGTVTVTITGTSGSLTNSTTLSLTVNASGGQVIAVPASVNFPNVVIGHTHSVNVKLENVGTTAVEIGSVSLTVIDGDASDFSFHRFCGSPLKPGKSCIIGVTFSPDAVGTDTATLNVPTNAPGSPVEVPLTGTGVNKK